MPKKTVATTHVGPVLKKKKKMYCKRTVARNTHAFGCLLPNDVSDIFGGFPMSPEQEGDQKGPKEPPETTEQHQRIHRGRVPGRGGENFVPLCLALPRDQGRMASHLALISE